LSENLTIKTLFPLYAKNMDIGMASFTNSKKESSLNAILTQLRLAKQEDPSLIPALYLTFFSARDISMTYEENDPQNPRTWPSRGS
jgi:hypothetical protein